MADEKQARPSLRDRSADQVRNEQRGGANSPVDPERDGGPEGNATLRRAWSEPGGEEYAYRQAHAGQTSNAGFDGHGELTAAETPEATKHLSDATLKPEEPVSRQDNPTDAEEAADRLGQDDPEADKHKESEESRTPTTGTIRNPGGLATDLQPGGTVPGKSPAASVGSERIALPRG